MMDQVTAFPGTRKRIGIAADHGGFELKEQLSTILREAGYEVVDFGDSQLNPDEECTIAKMGCRVSGLAAGGKRP